jgi:Fe-S cluster assembly protein SufD
MQNKLSKKDIKKINYQIFNYKENWRYTNIVKLQKIDYYNTSIITKNVINNNTGIDIINNCLINNTINDEKIFTENLSNSLKKNLFNCVNSFNKIIPQNKNEFILYNKKFFKKGFFLNLSDNVNPEEPIHINNLINTNKLNSFLSFRYLFQFGKNNNVKIILKNNFIKKLKLNTLIEILIEENSNIDLIIESDTEDITQIFNFAANIKTNSKLNIYTINFSGKLIRNNYFIDLNHKNSCFNYYGVNLISEKNHIDDYIEIKHHNNHTNSNCSQKNILQKNSKGIFYNKTTIGKNGAHSSSKQNNKNIMLSPTATVHSNPQLKIYNNEVKCTHGSTTGQLDNEMLFYLQSRGINLKDSKMMLLSGFINQFIELIDIKEYSRDLNDKINHWLDYDN